MIVGDFIFISEDEFYNFGQIEAIFGDCFVVKLQSAPGLNIKKIYNINFLCMAENDVFLFDTENDLKKWLDHIESDDEKKLKIVNFERKQ